MKKKRKHNINLNKINAEAKLEAEIQTKINAEAKLEAEIQTKINAEANFEAEIQIEINAEANENEFSIFRNFKNRISEFDSNCKIF